jgi:hypothetical protein
MHTGCRQISFALLTAVAAASTAAFAQDGASESESSVTVFRERSMINVLIKPGVVIDGKEYATLPSGGCMTVPLGPGAHTIDLKLSDRYQGQAARTVEVGAHSSAYARVSTRNEQVDYRTTRRVFQIDQTDEATFIASMPTCKPIDPENGKRFKKSHVLSDN